MDCCSFFISHCKARNIRFKKMPFYAVEVGVRPGIYSTWTECESIVKGFTGPKFKNFMTKKKVSGGR